MEQEQGEALIQDSGAGASPSSASGTGEDPKKKSKQKRERGPQLAFDLSMAFAPFALAAVVVSVLGLASSFLTSGMPGWVCELCATFRTQCIILLFVCTIPSILSKPWRIMGFICFGLGLFNLLLISPLLDFSKTKKAESSYLSFNLMSMLVESSDITDDQVLALAEEQDPEILVIENISLGRMAALNPKISRYHHRALFPDDNGYGILIYSRAPLKGSRVELLGKDKIPVTITTAFFEYGWTNIVAVRAPEVVDGDSLEKRNNLFEAVSEMVSKLKGPTILCGNINVSPYAGSYGKLLGKSNLKVLHEGIAIKPNTYAGPQDFIVNRISTDNIFANDKVAFAGRTIISGFSGRNQPVKGTFSLSNKDEKWVAPAQPAAAPQPTPESAAAPAAKTDSKEKNDKKRSGSKSRKSRRR